MQTAMSHPVATKPAEVYYFGTCLIDLFFPEAGLAGMQLLRREGVRVIFPRDQSCCGQPAWNSGYRADALAVARRQLALFPREIPVVVPSGSCAGMLRHQYPRLFANDVQRPQAEALASRVFELTELLVDVLDIRLRDLGSPLTVAVHSSCSARREMGVADRTDRLIAQLERVNRVDQAYAEECCGFGGTFAVKQSEISAAMVQDKTHWIRESGAQRLVSQDCGCLMNILGALEHQGGGPAGQHIASFLWERTHADGD